MYDSGCRWIYFGIESGSKERLAKVKKGIAFDQIMETVDEAQLVQKIGHILILYRPSTKKAPKDRIRLPKDEKK
jgi:radical SAM superfamily enzyme YgiQ (UPF0313 family)